LRVVFSATEGRWDPICFRHINQNVWICKGMAGSIVQKRVAKAAPEVDAKTAAEGPLSGKGHWLAVLASRRLMAPLHAASGVAIGSLARFVLARPILARSARKLLQRFPRLRARLGSASINLTSINSTMAMPEHIDRWRVADASALSPRAQAIYAQLKIAITQNPKNV